MGSWSRKLAPYLFISPFFLGYGVFFLFPVLWAARLSLFQMTGIGSTPVFIGAQNYLALLQDDLFRKALGNTTYYALGSILLIVPAALGLALLLTRRRLRWREFFRLFFFSPNITSGVVVAIIFGLVFEHEYGLINNLILAPLGFPKIRWLLDAEFILPAIILLGLWRWTGINALYFMAGLQNIPSEIKEAAIIDGANRWASFRYIILPLLRPVIIFVMTFAIIGSYNLFAEPALLTRDVAGGPDNGGLFMTMLLYMNGFRFLKFGYAAALGISLALIILVLTFIQIRILGLFRDL